MRERCFEPRPRAAELSDGPLAFSGLIGTSVIDQSGRKLGRVFDLRPHRDRDGMIVVDKLMLGGRALLGGVQEPIKDLKVEIGAL